MCCVEELYREKSHMKMMLVRRHYPEELADCPYRALKFQTTKKGRDRVLRRSFPESCDENDVTRDL